MDNKKIHSGLDDSEVRDYLSKQLRKETLSAEYNLDIGYLQNTIIELEESIIKTQNKIDHAKEALIIEKLIEKQGWKKFDISDYVKYSRDTYFYFLGTENEFEGLINSVGKGE